MNPVNFTSSEVFFIKFEFEFELAFTLRFDDYFLNPDGPDNYFKIS